MATYRVTPTRQPDADRDRAFDKIYGRFVEELNALRCVKVVIDREYDQANEDLAPRRQPFRASTLENPVLSHHIQPKNIHCFKGASSYEDSSSS